MYRPERQCTYQDLVDVNLGDVITVGVSGSLSVRAVVRALPQPVGTMAGFVVAGEIGPQCVLLGVPVQERDPVNVYTPLDHVPESARSAVSVVQGVIAYWAPHLPNTPGTMGELGYKVCKVRGSVDPMVLIWRGRERVVFWRTGALPMSDLLLASMPRTTGAQTPGQRYAALVGAGAVDPYPAPVLEPVRHLSGTGWRR
jgi:hypothetical protein